MSAPFSSIRDLLTNRIERLDSLTLAIHDLGIASSKSFHMICLAILYVGATYHTFCFGTRALEIIKILES
ncbi:hypothetical protein ACFP97_000329 [Acinetobacter baumannii]